MARLQGKVAVVTGGAGGIGSAIARVFVREGAIVTITDITEKQGEATAKEIGCDFLRLDVTNEQQWADVIKTVDQKHQGIHVLVNAAGTEGKLVGTAGSPELTTLEEWRFVHGINLDGTFLGCRAVLPIMKRFGSGSIINISSVVSCFGTPANCAYGSSKAGVQQFTKSVALHGSRDKKRIRCNSVHPGVIRTRMVKNIFAEVARSVGISAEDAEKNSLRAIPFGTIGEPEDVANLILYLASDESKYVTGSEFQVDGGWHLVDPENN